MLDIIQQQEQEYPILGPRRYANRGQKYNWDNIPIQLIFLTFLQGASLISEFL